MLKKLIIFSLILFLFPVYSSPFELYIQDGVNESMVMETLAHIPSNATIGLKKISVYSDMPKFSIYSLHEWLNRDDPEARIYGAYSWSLFTKSGEIKIFRASTELSDIYIFFDTIRHELGHHYDNIYNNRTVRNIFKTGEEYINSDEEIFADNFEILPKCGCPKIQAPEPNSSVVTPNIMNDSTMFRGERLEGGQLIIPQVNPKTEVTPRLTHPIFQPSFYLVR